MENLMDTIEEYRLPAKGKFLGVSAWLANKTDIDVTWVRLAFVLTTVFGVGSPILVYFAMWIVLAFTK